MSVHRVVANGKIYQVRVVNNKPVMDKEIDLNFRTEGKIVKYYMYKNHVIGVNESFEYDQTKIYMVAKMVGPVAKLQNLWYWGTLPKSYLNTTDELCEKTARMLSPGHFTQLVQCILHNGFEINGGSFVNGK